MESNQDMVCSLCLFPLLLETTRGFNPPKQTEIQKMESQLLAQTTLELKKEKRVMVRMCTFQDHNLSQLVIHLKLQLLNQ
jgi:hypothetical protein